MCRGRGPAEVKRSVHLNNATQRATATNCRMNGPLSLASMKCVDEAVDCLMDGVNEELRSVPESLYTTLKPILRHVSYALITLLGIHFRSNNGGWLLPSASRICSIDGSTPIISCHDGGSATPWRTYTNCRTSFCSAYCVFQRALESGTYLDFGR
jgi:hypothetical protein